MKLNPNSVILLIQQALAEIRADPTTQGFKDLDEAIVKNLNKQDPGRFATGYTHKMWLNAKKKAKKNEDISLEMSKINTVAKFVGSESFQDFEKTNLNEIVPNEVTHYVERNFRTGDVYERIARYLPTAIISIPLFLLGRLFMPEFNTIYFILLYLLIVLALSYFVAELSKHWEVKYFLKKKGFPTTYFMLYANHEFPVELKEKYRSQVEKNFNLKIPEREKEQINDIEFIKIMNIATKLVISTTQTSKIQMLLIRYGLARNFTGGSILGSLFSLVIGVFYFYQNLSLMLPFALLSSFLVIFFSKKYFITKTAENYARELLITFLK